MSTYLKTLRRIPDDIVLSIASRDIVPTSSRACICGWAVRESIARSVNMVADNVEVCGVLDRCVERFGGERDEWRAVFNDIWMNPPGVERAFVTRVMEAAGVA